jgi:competence protein ComEC
MDVKGFRVAYLREGVDAAAYCRGVDILVTDFPLRRACAQVPVRIDRFDVWRNGAYAVFVRDGGIEVTTAADQRGLRPWTTPPVARWRTREGEE